MLALKILLKLFDDIPFACVLFSMDAQRAAKAEERLTILEAKMNRLVGHS